MDEKEYYQLKQDVALSNDRLGRMETAIERIATSSEKTAEAVMKSESVNRFLGVVMGLLIPLVAGGAYYFVGMYSETNKDQYAQISHVQTDIIGIDKRVTILEEKEKKK